MKKLFYLLITGICFSYLPTTLLYADDASEQKKPQKNKSNIICTGDKVIYHRDKNMSETIGNVVIGYDNVKVLADRGEFHLDTMKATTAGNVLILGDEEFYTGDKVNYNLKEKTGNMAKAHSYNGSWYGYGKEVERVSEDKFIIKDGYITTCDYQHPHYKLKAKTITIYPGDNLYAYNMIFTLGDIPLFYFPYYRHSLSKQRSAFALMPGYSSKFGAFILSETFLDLKKYDATGTFHNDYYAKRGYASGIDIDYNNATNAKANFRSYYINDDNYIPKRGTKTDNDRYRASFEGDYTTGKTKSLLSLNLISDLDFLDEFYYTEFESNTQLNNYFSLIYSETNYQIGLLVKKRLNNIYSVFERLPEITFNLNSQQIKDSNFYYTANAYLANLNSTSTTGPGYNTSVVDVVNTLSYNKKLFRKFTVSPYVSMTNSYFSRGVTDNGNLYRDAFEAGTGITTKISRVFNYKNKKLDINLLRHVIQPTISYRNTFEPSVDGTELLTRPITKGSSIQFDIRNKLQTKRIDEDQSMPTTAELIDLNLSTTYFPYDYITRTNDDRDFSDIYFDLEITPYAYTKTRWYMDYDQYTGHLESSYIDFTFLDEGVWSVSLGHRYNRESSNLIAFDTEWQLTPEWFLKTYIRFDSKQGKLEEHEYSIIKNLHCWNVSFTYTERKLKDEKIFFINFYLKDLPGESIFSSTLSD